MLWLSGKAGCGKTILCSTVVEDLSSLQSASDFKMRLAHYYFSFNNPEDHGLPQFLATVAMFMCDAIPSVFNRAKSIYKSRHASTNKPTPKQSEELLNLGLEYVTLFLVIDALDEVSEEGGQRQLLLNWIRNTTQTGRNIKIMLTSRVYRDIEATMVACHASQISVQDAATDLDIKRYVAQELQNDQRFHGLSDESKDRIERDLGLKADGM
jgi:hypothetical protein